MEDKIANTPLREKLTANFNLAELKGLCFDMGFDFEELPNPSTKSEKIIGLIEMSRRHGTLSKLVELCREKRPYENRQKAIQEYKNNIQADEIGRDDLLQDFTLDEIYIPLKGQDLAEEQPQEDDSDLSADNGLSPESPFEQTKASAPIQQHQNKKKGLIVPRRPSPLNLQEVAEKHEQLIVLGAAGTGKSTFLHYLAHQKTKNQSDVIPIFVQLSNFADVWNEDSKLEFEEWAVNAAPHSNQAQCDALKEEIATGHVLWLLDGFDEAIKKVNDPKNFTNSIARFVTDQQFVLTTRPDNVVIKRLRRFSDAAQYEMRDLIQNDVEQFLQKWFGEQNKTAEVLEWLADDPHRQRLITKPLHLVLLATITKEASKEDFPETRVQLYEKFIDIFLNKHIEEKTGGKGIDYFPLGDMTGSIAREAALKGFHYLGWVLFHQGIKESTNKTPTPKEQVVACLKQAGGNLEQNANAIFLFWQESGIQESLHLSFWPYATACKLYGDWQTDAENAWLFLSSAAPKLPYASRLHHPNWKEPILMLAASMDEGQLNNLIDRLLSKRDKEERYLHQNLRLAAAILGEIGTGKIEEKYEQQIIKKLGELTRNYPKAHQTIKDVGLWSMVVVLVFELLLLSQWHLLMQFEWFPIIQLVIVSILVVRRLGKLSGGILWAYRHHELRYILDLELAKYALGALGILGLELLILYKGLPLLPFVISVILWIIFRFIEYPGWRGDSIWSPFATNMRFRWRVENMFIPVLRVMELDTSNPQAFIEVLALGGESAIPELEHTFVYWDIRKDSLLDRIYPSGHWALSRPSSHDYEVVKGLEKIGGNKVIPFLSHIMNDWSGRISYAATDALGRIGNKVAVENLLHALKNSSDEDIQRSVTIALGKSGDKRAIPSLIHALKNPAYNFDREPAAQALIEIGNSTIPALCDALRDENINSDTRQEIAKIMGEIGDPQVIPVLLKWLENRKGHPKDMRDELAQIEKILGHLGKNNEKYANQYLHIYKTRQDWDVRRVAMHALGKIGVTSVVPELINLLLTEPQDLIIAETLASIGDTRAIQPIIRSLKNAEYVWLTHRLIGMLGQFKDKRVIQFLMETLAHGTEDARANAAVSLGNIGDEIAVDMLILALEDRSILVRMNAAEALGKIKSPKALEPLLKAMESPEFTNGNQWLVPALVSALAALVRHGDVAAVPILKSIFPTYDPRIVEATIQALGEIGDITAIDILIKPGLNIPFGMYNKVSYDDVIEELRENKEAAIPQLIQRLSTKHDYWTDMIAKALGEIGDERAVPILIETLASNDRSIGREAARSLGKIGRIEAVMPLVNTLKDKRKTDLHPEAVISLGQLAGSISDDNLLQSARKVLWQRRFAPYKEDVFLAYEKIITNLTITQVHQLSQNNANLGSGVSTKISFLSYPRVRQGLLVFLAAVILLSAEISSGLFTEIVRPYLPSGIVGGIIIATFLLLIIVLLIGIEQHFND